MRTAWGVFGLAVACGFGARPALADGLNVKTGLWEVESSGGMPRPAMPQLPPDQLAKLPPQAQAMMQRMANGDAAPPTRRICVTPATLQKGFAASQTERHCTRTLVSSSATEMKIKIVCAGPTNATGTITVDAQDPENATSTIDMTATMKDGTTVPIHRTVQSHWLADDCGGVKPTQ